MNHGRSSWRSLRWGRTKPVNRQVKVSHVTTLTPLIRPDRASEQIFWTALQLVGINMQEMFNKALRSEQREEEKPAGNKPLCKSHSGETAVWEDSSPAGCFRTPATAVWLMLDPVLTNSHCSSCCRTSLFLAGFRVYLSEMANSLGVFHLTTDWTLEKTKSARWTASSTLVRGWEWRVCLKRIREELFSLTPISVTL